MSLDDITLADEMSLGDMTRLTLVVRWEADATGRLREAAMQLYLERGFEQTTVAEIALRAGLTARTFFRYFADKREVLFGGASILEENLVVALEAAPASAAPMEAIAAALDAAAETLGQHREYSRQRQSVINANPELQERELIKMASLAAALGNGLRRRGIPDPDATLAAEAGIVVLRVGFERWVGEATGPDLSQHMRDALDRLKTITIAR
jgi:AcrR family transcriptional regulator